MRLLLLVLSLVTFHAHAQGPNSSSFEKMPVLNDKPEHNNFFNTGIIGIEKGAAVSLGYARPVSGQFLIGAMGIWGSQGGDDHEGGSLDNAQYYKEETSSSSNKAELNGAFYFKEQGYARWGFLMKGGIGHAWNKAKGTWKRYDRDPAWFRIGDEKRLRESGGEEIKWESTYARLGGYYQMAFNFHAGSPVGHVLQFGVVGLATDQERTIKYTKPNGEQYSRKYGEPSLGGELSYTVSF